MADGSPERPPRVESGEIATSTLAEIYAQQGLLGRALSIYRRMLTRTPDDNEIAGRILSLERRIAETGAEPAVERGSDLAAPRERLPWDPPVEGVPHEPVGSPSGDTEAAEAGGEAPRRWGPIDARAFEAWLEGR